MSEKIPVKEGKKKAAIYCRVSTYDQSTGEYSSRFKWDLLWNGRSFLNSTNHMTIYNTNRQINIRKN